MRTSSLTEAGDSPWEDVENNALMPVFDGTATVKDVAADIVAGVEEVLANEK